MQDELLPHLISCYSATVLQLPLDVESGVTQWPHTLNFDGKTIAGSTSVGRVCSLKVLWN